MMSKIDLSIVVPVYNEELNIEKLYERATTALAPTGLSLEFVLVNDGSRDSSLRVLMAMAERYPNVKYINLSRNFGHQIAVMAGLDHTVGDKVVIIDADLQDPPEAILDMLAKMKEGFEVVYAKRRRREGESFMKLLTAKYFYRILAKITSISIPVDTGDFRIIDRKVVEVLKKMPEQHKFLRGQISWIGFRQSYIEYDRSVRAGGQTGYTYAKMIKFALDGITGFSDFPLKVATLSGFVVSGISFLVGMYALYGKFFRQDTVSGWASIIVSVLFLGGIQLISIGIIGEYISRIGQNVRNRPLYIIADSNLKETSKA